MYHSPPQASAAERVAAMGDGELVGLVDFREGLAERRVLEEGVVAEPGAAAGLARNQAFDDAAGFERHATLLDDGERADEPRRCAGRSGRASSCAWMAANRSS